MDVLVWLIVVGLPLALALALLATLLRDSYRTFRPLRLINQGRFEEARVLSGKPWWMKRLMPSARLSSDYNIAICLMHEGRLQEATDRLEALATEAKTSSPHLHGVIANALATNLLVSGQQPRRAQTLLEQATQVMSNPSDWMALALARQRAGSAGASECVERAERQGPTKVRFGLRAVLYHPEPLESAAFSLMRALYLEENGDLLAARQEYERAAESSVPSIYRTLAREKLNAKLPDRDEDDEPSSLAPQVLSGPS